MVLARAAQVLGRDSRGKAKDFGREVREGKRAKYAKKFRRSMIYYFVFRSPVG